jgi:hypothetical protein
VVLDRDRWKVVTAVAAGTSVGAVGEHLGLGEVAISRKVKELVEMGLAEIDVRNAPVTAVASAAELAPEPEIEPEPVLAPTSWATDLPGSDLIAAASEPEPAPVVEAPAPVRKPTKAKAVVASVPEDVAVPGMESGAEAVDPDDVARQLANLSPRAAKAVRAAAAATTDEEREAALAAVADDGDEPLNRGLLLKFLSSVRT